MSRLLLSSSSTVVSGACLSIWLSVAAGPLHWFSRGAHEMRSRERTAWLCVQPVVSGGTESSRVCLATRCSWCSSGKVLEAVSPFPFPISGVFSVYRGFGRCAVVSPASWNVGLVALCGPRELDSVARERTDFELLCSTPLRNVSKSFILGLASTDRP